MDYNSISTHSAQPISTDFTNVSLEENESKQKKRVPRRIIHCSDGILEEYSTDEEEETPPPKPVVDPKTLNWGWWTWYMVSMAAWKTYTAADFCGEKLAWFFGITTPKYQAAIDEYYRLKREEEEEAASEKRRQERIQGLSDVTITQVSKQEDHAIEEKQKF